MSEQPPPRERFNGDIKVSDTYPYDLSTVPSDEREYLVPREGAVPYYFVAEEKGKPLGFVVVDVDKNNHLHLVFKYVSSDERRRGVGQVLTNKVYEWAVAQGFSEILSGINDVLKINEDGSVEPVFSPRQHGGWPSYGGFTKSDGRETKVRRDITFARISKGGWVSLGFVTHLNTEADELMPDTVEELVQKLYDSNILPKDVSLQELRNLTLRGNIVLKDGKILPLREWLNSLEK